MVEMTRYLFLRFISLFYTKAFGFGILKRPEENTDEL